MSGLHIKQRAMLSLIGRSASDSDGWVKVTQPIWNILDNLKMPSELVILQQSEKGGRAKLTSDGKAVLKWS